MSRLQTIVLFFLVVILFALMTIIGILSSDKKGNKERLEIEFHNTMRESSHLMCIVNADEFNMSGEFRVMDVVRQRRKDDVRSLVRTSVILDEDKVVLSPTRPMIFRDDQCGKVVLSEGDGQIIWAEAEGMTMTERVALVKAGRRNKL